MHTQKQTRTTQNKRNTQTIQNTTKQHNNKIKLKWHRHKHTYINTTTKIPNNKRKTKQTQVNQQIKNYKITKINKTATPITKTRITKKLKNKP